MIARVCVDSPLPHLDRLFDYLVPADWPEQVTVGARVRVRFAGRLLDGFVIEVGAASAHDGKLSPLARLTSAEPALSAEVAELARTVADRYAGTLSDVLRLAVPPRRAAPEGDEPAQPSPPPATPDPAAWAAYPHGDSWLAAVGSGRPARAVWTARPGDDWPARLAEAALATAAGGRGALLVVPDVRDVARVDAALRAAADGSGSQHVVLTAESSPTTRYRRFLTVRRGSARIVVGTRAAAFAPVVDLGLVAIWDDGDDLHAEPRAPYPHVREVLALRAHQRSCAMLLGGWSRTAEAASLLASGWAHELATPRTELRMAAPRIQASGDDFELVRDPAAASARLPTLAWQVARETLAAGAAVLVQVPRRGYVPSLACERCRRPARCLHCAGPLGFSHGRAEAPSCRWCGRPATAWQCPSCSDRRVRAAVSGAGRTAEELGRAFPGVPVRTSGRSAESGVLDRVDGVASLVVATPGAEPVADGGYGAALLLDSWALLGRADLRAGEEALRRWLGAAALVRSASAGGRVIVMAESSSPAVQALVRWDPAGLADRELADRRELSFPPAVRMAAVTGTSVAVSELLAAARLPGSAEVLGPVAVATTDGRRGRDGASEEPGQVRALVRAPRSDGAALAAALHAAASVRSAAKAAERARIQLDPVEIG